MTEVDLGDFLYGIDGTYVIQRAPTSVGGENMVHLEPEVMAES